MNRPKWKEPNGWQNGFWKENFHRPFSSSTSVRKVAVYSHRYRVHSHSLRLERADAHTPRCGAFPLSANCIQGGNGLGRWIRGDSCLVFFGAFYTGNRAFRVAFLLIILILVFWLYHMSKSLATVGELLRLERRPAESDYCALMPSPHINCCQDALDRGKMGGMSATLENIRVNLPSPEKYRMTYWSCSGSRRAISSLHLSTK